MGFYRFALAIGVVFFHLGGGTWIVGRSAVFCFYFISGFLICRVFDSAYWGSPRGLAAFYSNRALRLLPLFVVISAVTVLALTAHGSNVFPRGPDELLTLLNDKIVGTAPLADAIPRIYVSNSFDVPFVTGDSDTIPQGWSIGVELVFYLIAPLMVLIGRRSYWPLAIVATIATVLFVAASLRAPDVRYIDNVIYKNAVTSVFTFLWGGVTYVVMRDTKIRIPIYVTGPVVVLFAYYIYAWAASDELGTHEMSAGAFVANNLLAIPVSALVCLTAVPDKLRGWEKRLGDLTYGIYLNHFLVAIALLWVAEAIGSPIFGRYNKPEFGFWAATFCVVLAFATLHLVEQPVDRLRALIKRRIGSLPATAPASAPSSGALGEIRI